MIYICQPLAISAFVVKYFPAMATSMDAGDYGFIEVLSWYPGHKCIAKLQALSGSMPPPFEVVLQSAEEFKEGKFRILEKDFTKRRCIMEICTANDDVAFLFKVHWLLDVPATALQVRSDINSMVMGVYNK